MTDYESMRVSELREEAERRGLSSSGTKDELVARLELSDANEEPAPEAPSEPQAQDQQAEPPHVDYQPPTGLPVQMRPENQDASVAGKVVDERGRVIRTFTPPKRS